MNVIAAPDSVDLQNFQFKLQRRVIAYSSTNYAPNLQVNLVAAASRLGLLFVGTPDNSLHVFQLRTLVSEDGTECPRRILPLPSQAINISLNCNQDLLCVVYNKNSCLIAAIYDASKCASQNLILIKEIRLSPSSDVQLCRLLWNPCIADTLAVCISDGSLSVYQCKQNSIDVQSKPTNASCLSWSPKGKQIVTGNKDGTLSQYKPDLTLVKNIPAPILFGNNPMEAITIHWISNYQFSVVYRNVADPDSRPCVTIINAPKVGSPSCINYEDICYSMGNARPTQFFLMHLANWGVLLASSANSMEIGVLGTKDQNNWQQWIQMDEARAELPLTDDKQENYPIGIAYDDAAIHQLPWGDNQKLPPMPMIHILSHTGTLVSFYVINIGNDVPMICSPSEEIQIPQHLLSTNIQVPSLPESQPTPVIQQTVNTQQDISFAISNAITSTPTLPKLSSSFSLQQTATTNPIVTNLFGVKKEPEVIKPAEEVIQKPTPIIHKPQPTITSVTSAFTTVKQEKPVEFQKPSEVYNKQHLQPEKKEVIQPKTQIIKPKPIQHQEPVPEPPNTYEAMINMASSDTIKAMLIKEINMFQMQLYELLKKCQSVNTQVGTPSEMKQIITVMDDYGKEPNGHDSNSDVKNQIAILKQYLVKMCSILIEAKLQPASLELEKLAQLDPISADKMLGIKRNLYYVESQLKQVSHVLDDQWNCFQEQCKKKIEAIQGINSGDLMKMPTLEKIYQPMVKHQDIITKQLATVNTLQKVLDNIKPQIYSSKLGRSLTKTDVHSAPLSTLTKNLLNLSLQPNDIIDAKYKKICSRDAKFTLKKQNSLREMLADRHVRKIKPVKMDPPNRLQSLLNNHSLSLVSSESSKKAPGVEKPHTIEPIQIVEKTPQNTVQTTSISSVQKTTPTMSKTPEQMVPENNALNSLNKFVSNLNVTGDHAPNVRTNVSAASLFNSKINPVNESVKVHHVTAINTTKAIQPSANTTGKPPPNVTITTPSIFSSKFDIASSITSNSFMGQKICSPTPKPIESNIQPTQISFTKPATNYDTKQSVTITKVTIPQMDPKPILQPSTVSVSCIIKVPTLTSTPAPSTTDNTVKIITSQPQNKESSQENVPLSTPSTVFSVVKLISPTSAPATISTKSEPSKPTLPQTPGGSPFNFSSTPVPTSTTAAKPKPLVPSVNTSTPSTEPQAITTSTSSTSVPNTADTQSKPLSSSIFGTVKSTSSVSTTPSATSSGTAVSTTSTSVFGVPAAITTTASLFSGVTTTPNAASVFSVPTTPTAIAVSTTQSSVTSSGSIFGSSTTTPLFSTPNTAATEFSGPPSPSIFGGATITTATSPAFGSPAGTPVSTPAFGGSPPAANSLFASANANIASTGNLFESLTVTTTSGSTNVFGSPTATTCASSIFGAANAVVPSTITSLFGSTTISTAASPFGSPSNSNSGGSLFGGNSTFGSAPTFGQPGASVFGGGNSAFGQPQTQTNIFGGGNSSFGSFGSTSPSSNIFSQPAGAQPSNIFGGVASPTTQSSVFGGATQGQSIFGSPPSALPGSGSLFGSPPGQSSVFGGAAAFGSKPVFGQTTGFGSPTNSGGFGAFSGAGDQQNVAQAGFGSPSAFSKPGAVFGGSPTFGSPGGFGSPPTFGGAASFGSPVKMFGSPGTDTGFGASQSSTFENLATQSTLTFGNLAQQTQQPQPAAAAFQGNPSFSSWR